MIFENILFRIINWERWHYLTKYIPIAPAWFWYCLKARSFWFFTASNPGLTFGGFEGESKKEMYDQLPPGSYPRSIYISNIVPFDEVELLLYANDFGFPIATKPDVGMMGFMFRKISTLEELRLYHKKMPADYIIQDFINYPVEVSVFYYRLPQQEKGMITGFLKKEFMEVKGNGKSTLCELIKNYPRVRFRIKEMKLKHFERLNEIVPKGETYYLSYALNLSRGGRLVSLEHEKDDRLLKIFDDLSHYTKHFFYGRYDIKCTSVEDLKSGKNFSILEYNGSGAEPHHVYGNGNNLFQVFKILIHHWNVLYQISVYNNKRGIHYWKFNQGWKYLMKAKKHFRILKKLDAEFPVY